MALTRLQNIISSVEGRIIYVNPDDFDATDAIDNKGNSPIRPFKTIARAVLEVARYSYVSAGNADDKFDQFTILLYPGDHIVDNRPGSYAYKLDGSNNIVPNVNTQFTELAQEGNLGWSNSTKQYGELFKIVNSTRGGLIIPRGVSIIGLDLRKTKLRPKYVPGGGNNTAAISVQVNFDVNTTNRTQITINSTSGGDTGTVNDIYVGAEFRTGIQDANGNNLIEPGTTVTSFETALGGQTFNVNISKPHAYTSNTSGIIGTLKVPFEDDNTRTALFRITGGCYFWQFSIFDGDPNGVYNASPVVPVAHDIADGAPWAATVSPFFSHTKLTIFEYASLHDLHVFYRRISDAVTLINSEKIEPKIQENRIVGPLADSVQVTKVQRNAATVTVTLAEELNLTAGNFVSIKGDGDFITGSPNTNGFYSGEKRVSSVISRSEFTYIITPTEAQDLDVFESDADGDPLNGTQITYEATIGASAKVEIEIDTVESASPYIFNISLRSTYGTCGMHADGSRATGFKSMVVAQYTGISLQKEDSAFYVYDGSAGQYVAAGAGGHTNINSIYKPEARSFHVKASNRAVIQAVSVFAVGFADHFIAEDGGDMSITNSNSNFGSNSMRSIGFSDTAFNKDSLGEVTHIIPPRNIESAPSNVYWESIDTVKTQAAASNTRLYVNGRTSELAITAPGSGFTGGNYEVSLNGVALGKNLTVTVSNGEVVTATFQNEDYGNLQPGDKVTIASPAAGGLPAEIAVGGTLTSNAGEFKIGYKSLDKDGVAENELLYVPLFELAGSTEQSVQSARVDKDATTQRVFEYDYTLNNWYIRVSSSFNDIYSVISTNTTRYGSTLIEATPTSYITRLVDERVDDDKIFRLRYVTHRGDNGTLPSFPQAGYVIQPKKGQVRGIGDRFTDAANLLLLNKETMATDVVSRYKTYVGGGQLPNTDSDATTSCEEDIIKIIETVAYDLRYGGNARTYDGAAYYAAGGLASGATGIQGERDETVAIINSISSLNGGADLFDGLKVMFNNVINNGVTVAPVNAQVWGNSPGNLTAEYISGEEQLTNTTGGCTNVVSAANTLLNIYTTALGSDATPGTLGSVTRVTYDSSRPSEQENIGDPFFNVYDRISGQEFNDVYYIYEVEEEQAFSYDEVNQVETPGIYYLTVLKGSVYINGSPTASDAALANNTFRFSQEIEDLYPAIDIDNVVSDPIIAKSVADPEIIGRVNTQDGTNSNINIPVDKAFSITKESLAYFFDEYLNNEVEWDWDGIGDNTITHRRIANPTDGSSNGVSITSLSSRSGDTEVRKIDLNPGESGWKLEVELRRPSTIRSGNHTFEYVGFGPGNYSTAFPIRQTKVLTPEEQKYSQSLKEAGGIAFYSGLNSNGDLYIGNTVINAVTGKTTSNEISELTTLTIRNNLNVLGGTGNSIASNFQGPINMIGNLNADGGDYVFSNLQLRNPAGFITKFTNGTAANLPVTDLTKSDIQFNLNPVDGGSVGHVYTDDNEWRPFGLIGTEKLHVYKSTNSDSQHTLNVGSSLGAAGVAYNDQFDLDVTGRQRITKALVIGNSSTDTTFESLIDDATNKGSLLINPDWTAETNVNKYGMIIKLKSQGNGKYVDFRTVTNSSVFTVDQAGNVEIPSNASYGNAAKAWSVTLTVVASGVTAGTNNIIFSPTAGNFFQSSPINQYQGTSILGSQHTPAGFVWVSNDSLDSKIFYGSPGELSQYLGKSNSVMIFVNGIMQDPFVDSHLASNGLLYFTGQPQPGDTITIRGFAT